MNEKTKKVEELTDEAVEQVTGGIREPEVLQARCPQCNSTFYYRAHGGNGPYSCPNCGYKFPQGPDSISRFGIDTLSGSISRPDIQEK